MRITLQSPLSINHIGGRSNNEDSVFPLMGNANQNDKLFLVCDGVGGNEKGEIASKLACEKFAEYFINHPKPYSDEAFINEALKYTESAFDEYIEKYPESKGMGTTLTLLHFHDNGATIAHIGDSRVYQFRNDKILHQTDDHSMVNDLLKAGVINEEQAKNHPRKNVISRAIQGGSVKPTKAEVKIISNIQAGDYFFMCTDGVLENISDFEINQILIQDISDTDKMNQVSSRCEENPSDNFSAYLIHINEVEGRPIQLSEEESIIEAEVIIDEEPEIIAEVEKPNTEINQKQIFQPPSKPSPIDRLKKLLPFIFLALVIVFVGYYLIDDNKTNPDNQKPKNEIPADIRKKVSDIELKKKKKSESEKQNFDNKINKEDNIEDLEAEEEVISDDDQNVELEEKIKDETTKEEIDTLKTEGDIKQIEI